MAKPENKPETFTRAQVRAMPNVSLVSAMVFDNDDEDDDASALAWEWIQGTSDHPRMMGLGDASKVKVKSSETDGRWIEVTD